MAPSGIETATFQLSSIVPQPTTLPRAIKVINRNMLNLVLNYLASFGLSPSSGMWKFETRSFWRAQLTRSTLPHPPEDGNRSSLRNVVVFCKTSTYQTMDRFQIKPNSSVQHTPSSESFQVYMLNLAKFITVHHVKGHPVPETGSNLVPKAHYAIAS
jgi:hypothetical protein